MNIRERFIWITITVVLLLGIGFIAITPSVIAQSSPGYDDTYEYLQVFDEVFRFIHDNYVENVPAEQLLEGALIGLFESLDDPYSYYLTANDMDDLSDTTTGNFGGVGLYISKQIPDDTRPGHRGGVFVEVIAPIEGTPAYRAGIHAGDLIIAIDDESTEDMSSDEVVDTLRGVAGTDVVVTILRGEKLTFDVTITRAIIEVPTVRHAMMPGGIGYLRIIQFTPFTDDRVKEAIEDFQDHDYTSLIIDLRQNPGGRLDSVVDIVDFFLKSGTIVSTRSRIPSENTVFSAKRQVLIPENLPIIVLIDKGSASASEILAGALKDTGRALLVGQTSFGKGSVQQIRRLGDGGFKMTMSRYFTPSGVNIDKIGIEPDRIVEKEEYTDEENEAYQRLLEEHRIINFVESHQEMSERDIRNFIKGLEEDNIILPEKIVRKLIREDYNRKLDFPPIYDLEFDTILQEAMNIIEKGDF